jgi:outer membrane immunogenic protein
VNKFAILAVAASAIAFPTTAFAQDSEVEVTVGATAGVHDLGVSDRLFDVTGVDVNDSSAIFGGFVAVDVPVTSNLFAGVEGNANIGTAAIDSEYGASLRFGYRAENGTKLYLRGGYQFIDLDVANILRVDDDLVDGVDVVDDTVDDYLVGAGVEVPVGGFSLRANVDTVSFDSVRATAGVALRF